MMLMVWTTACLLIAGGLAADPSETFVEECADAVLSITEGSCSSSGVIDGTRLDQGFIIGMGGIRGFMTAAGNAVADVSTFRDQTIAVSHADKTVHISTGPAFKRKSKNERDALEPLETNTFDYRLSSEHGFVFRSNPPFRNCRIEKKGSEEVMRVETWRAGKGKAKIELYRDQKTHLPLRFSYISKESKGLVKFKFEKRPVSDDELTIPPSSYDGYRKVEGAGSLVVESQIFHAKL